MVGVISYKRPDIRIVRIGERITSSFITEKGGKMKGEESQKIEMVEYTMEDARAHGFSSLELYKLWHWATCFPEATWHVEVYTCVMRIRDELNERFVELPADASGVPIKVGDRLTVGEYKFVVDYIEFHDGQFTVCDENGVAWACCDVEHAPDPALTEIDVEKESTTEDVRCSFCGNEKKDVSFLVRSAKSEDGPCICDECVMSAFSLMLYRGRGEQ
jgi:hypothetical protein